MKQQLPFNIFISLLLLALVFVIANAGMSYADASTTQMPGLTIDGKSDGHLQLHGYGFRPGSLVNLELKQRTGGDVVTGADVWVDARGSFSAVFDMTPVAEQVASLNGGSPFKWDDWIVVATASTGSISVPLQAGNVPQQ